MQNMSGPDVFAACLCAVRSRDFVCGHSCLFRSSDLEMRAFGRQSVRGKREMHASNTGIGN